MAIAYTLPNKVLEKLALCTIFRELSTILSSLLSIFLFFSVIFYFIEWNIFLFFFLLLLFFFTILYWFCHTSTCIRHGCTHVPHPEPPSHLPSHTIPLVHPSAPAPSFLYPASNLDWQFISYMILYMFQCHYPKSSHPLPLPQSSKHCSIHLCLFCSLAYRVIVTIFLNSIYTHSVQFSRSVVFNSLRPHESQHARPPCPSPTPGVHSDSRPSSQ